MLRLLRGREGKYRTGIIFTFNTDFTPVDLCDSISVVMQFDGSTGRFYHFYIVSSIIGKGFVCGFVNDSQLNSNRCRCLPGQRDGSLQVRIAGRKVLPSVLSSE